MKGAFTGASDARSGLFLDANGGTLLLDEIGAMPIELQPALLRALQERAVRPVGGTHEEPFDARVLAATNRGLRRAVDEGAFRADLLFRLEVLRAYLPAIAAKTSASCAIISPRARPAARAWRSPTTPPPSCATRGPATSGSPRTASKRYALAHDDLIAAKICPGRKSSFAWVTRAPATDHWCRAHRESTLRVERREGGAVLGIDRGTLYRRVKRPRSIRPTR